MTSPSKLPIPSVPTVSLHLDFTDQTVLLAALIMFIDYGKRKLDDEKLANAELLPSTIDAAQALIDRLS